MIVHTSGYYYIGSSVSIFDRWQSHWTLLKLGKHHSPELQELFNDSKPEDFLFRVIKYISKTEIKNKTKLTGKKLDEHYKRVLLSEEKKVMSEWSINWSLNKNKKHYK